MSLSEEERAIVVELELEKAQVAYNEAIWLMEIAQRRTKK